MNLRTKFGKLSAHGYGSCQTEYYFVGMEPEIDLLLDQRRHVSSTRACYSCIKTPHVSMLRPCSMQPTFHIPRVTCHKQFVMLEPGGETSVSVSCLVQCHNCIKGAYFLCKIVNSTELLIVTSTNMLGFSRLRRCTGIFFTVHNTAPISRRQVTSMTPKYHCYSTDITPPIRNPQKRPQAYRQING